MTEQTIAQGPVASQEFIKELGTNGGGFFNANCAHPFENPTPFSNFSRFSRSSRFRRRLTYTLGRMTGSQKHGWAVLAAMVVLFCAGVFDAYWAESRGNPDSGADQTRLVSARNRRQHGRQRGALRNRQQRAVRHRHHRRQLRRSQRDARQLHADRRHGSARQHHARRDRSSAVSAPGFTAS